jgi:hypothetical protein
VPTWVRDLRDWSAQPQAPDFWSTKVEQPGKTLATEAIRQLLGFGMDPRNQLNMLATTNVGKPPAPPATGIRAYHGSPHDFDRFDLSKLGTGEGAQSYGHGLYFAEAEPVARSYALSQTRTLVGGRSAMEVADELPSSSMEAARRWGVTVSEAARRMDIPRINVINTLASYGKNAETMLLNKPQELMLLRRMLKSGEVQFPEGHMYEVDLRVDPSQLLDYDVPLGSQSPAVQQAVRDVIGRLPPGYPGRDLYERAQAQYGRAAASDAFRISGVPGQRYRDQVSRARVDLQPPTFNNSAKQWEVLNFNGQLIAKEATPGLAWQRAQEAARTLGTRNYVIWDDSLIDILRKYGLPALITGAAYGAQQQGATPPPVRPVASHTRGPS